MRYALHRADGGVSIMHCLPVRAIKDGVVFKVDYLKRDGDAYRAFVRSEDQEVVIENVTLDWQAAGWTFEFNTPDQEIAKWPAESREQIVSSHPITDDDIPRDRASRGRWKVEGGKIVHGAKAPAASR